MKALIKNISTTIITASIFIGCGSNDIHGESSTPVGELNLQKGSFVFDTRSPYKNVLIDCINPEKSAKSCTLSKLPFIAQDSSTITKESIMERLVVSHPWMAHRFSALLDRYADKQIYNLFGAVTAIVIHKDIIPSYYTPKTGAIYLDPRYLWLTPDEAKTITVKQDFRSDYGNELQFITGSYFTHNGNSINTFKDLDSGLSRTLSEITLPFASLLYHELAHANDFAPPQFIRDIDRSKKVLTALEDLEDNYISTRLYNQSPLRSIKLASLGSVLYTGHVATKEEKELSGFIAGELFDEDNAADIYAYSSRYEDTATLFTNVMMKIHYGVDNNVVFVSAGIRTLEWGIRNPIAKASVKPRALLVANGLNPIPNTWDNLFATSVGTAHYLHTNASRNKRYNDTRSDEVFKNLKDLVLLPM